MIIKECLNEFEKYRVDMTDSFLITEDKLKSMVYGVYLKTSVDLYNKGYDDGMKDGYTIFMNRENKEGEIKMKSGQDIINELLLTPFRAKPGTKLAMYFHDRLIFINNICNDVNDLTQVNVGVTFDKPKNTGDFAWVDANDLEVANDMVGKFTELEIKKSVYDDDFDDFDDDFDE